MQDLELESLMQETANDAVKTAKEEFDIVLDFTIENVSLVDTTIERFVQNYPSQALDDKAVFTICNMYGAYLGETFRRLAGGKWHYDTSAPEAPTIMLVIKDKSYAFAGICFEKLAKDPKVKVQQYFAKALAANTN